MSGFKEFNLNSYVWVKLTDAGIAELRRQHDDLYRSLGKKREYTPPNIDDDGWTKFQANTLMKSFGHMLLLYSDSTSPFEIKVKFADSDLIDNDKSVV